MISATQNGAQNVPVAFLDPENVLLVVVVVGGGGGGGVSHAEYRAWK